MVFGFFSRKVDRARIYQDVRKVEQHFQNTILGAEPPVENVIEEFDLVLDEIPAIRTPEMLEPLLRLEELSAGMVAAFYVSRISIRLRGNLKRHLHNEELALYERVCAKHLEFLGELEIVFFPEIIRSKNLDTMVSNRQFHWLCELTKVACIKGVALPDEYFQLADEIFAKGKERGISDEMLAPYPGLYPEEKASLSKNKIRQFLITAFLNSELLSSDIDVANTLWRIMPFGDARFSPQKTPDATHFIAHCETQSHTLLRIYPELDERHVRLWFCGLRLAAEMLAMASKATQLVQNTNLGTLFSEVINEKSIERIAHFFSTSQSRENKRMRVSMETEVFTEIIDCICYLRRVNEDFLLALSDVDPKRKFHIHEQFEEMNFGYVDGHVNRTTRNVATESIAKSLIRKLDAEYANFGMEPSLWRIDDVSNTGYGLILPNGSKPPEMSGIVILSKENDEGIEFAVARRYSVGPEKSVLGCELLFPGCDVDPFFVLKCHSDGIPLSANLTDPYGFLLTGSASEESSEPSYSILLMSKKTKIPQRCTLMLKTLDGGLEGWVTGIRCEGFNWVAYQWKPL